MSQKGKRKCTNTTTSTVTSTIESYPTLDFDQNSHELRLKTQTQIFINNKTSTQSIKCDDEEKPFALIKLTDKSSKNVEVFMLVNSFKCQKNLLSNLKSESFDVLIERLNKNSSLFVAGEKLKSKIMLFPLFKSVLTDDTSTIMLIKMGPELFKLLSMIYQVQAIKIRQKTDKLDLPSNNITKITKKKVLNSNYHLHFITLDNGDDFILCSEIYRYLQIENSMFLYQIKKFPALKLYDGRLIFHKLKKKEVLHQNSPSVTLMRFQDNSVKAYLDSKSITISTPQEKNTKENQAPVEKDETSSSEITSEPSETNETETPETPETPQISEILEQEEESEEAILSDVIMSEDEEDEEEKHVEPPKKRCKSNINELFVNVPICAHKECHQVCDYQIKFADNTEFSFCKQHFPTILKMNYNLQIQTKTVEMFKS